MKSYLRCVSLIALVFCLQSVASAAEADPSQQDYYDRLGISRGATEAEIKSAFRKAIKVHHEDVGGTKENAQRITEAYAAIMKNPNQPLHSSPQVDPRPSAGPADQPPPRSWAQYPANDVLLMYKYERSINPDRKMNPAQKMIDVLSFINNESKHDSPYLNLRSMTILYFEHAVSLFNHRQQHYFKQTATASGPYSMPETVIKLLIDSPDFQDFALVRDWLKSYRAERNFIRANQFDSMLRAMEMLDTAGARAEQIRLKYGIEFAEVLNYLFKHYGEPKESAARVRHFWWKYKVIRPMTGHWKSDEVHRSATHTAGPMSCAAVLR